MSLNENCCVCNTPLSIDNMFPYHFQTHYFICKQCFSKRISEYRKKKRASSPEFRRKERENSRRWLAEHREYMKNYFRQNMVRVKGIFQKVKKRQRPEECEICGRTKKKLDYHHWDDSNPEWAVWVCGSCHRIAEVIDCFKKFDLNANAKSTIILDYVKRYIALKSRVCKAQKQSF